MSLENLQSWVMSHVDHFKVKTAMCLLVQFPVNTYQCSNVRVGLLVQQKLSDSVVATVSGHMQRCEVVQCDIINRCLVLQQEFDAL